MCQVFCSCNLSTKYYNPDEVLYSGGKGNGEIVELKDYHAMETGIRNINCIDEYLIITQEDKDSIFLIIDSRNDSILTQFGSVGHARNEFESIPWSIYCIRDKMGNPLLCIGETACTKIVNLKKSVSQKKCVVDNVIKDGKDGFFYKTYHLNKTSRFIHKEISYIDPRDGVFIKPEFFMEGQNTYTWEIFPEIIKSSMPNIVDCAYASLMFISPDASKAICMHNYIDVVTIFDFEKNRSTGIVNPHSYTFEDAGTKLNEDNIKDSLRWYNTSACVTNNRFLVLKDGSLYKDVAHKTSPEGVTVINSYSWDGDLQNSYCLNRDIFDIAYCEQSQKLYAIDLGNKMYHIILHL